MYRVIGGLSYEVVKWERSEILMASFSARRSVAYLCVGSLVFL